MRRGASEPSELPSMSYAITGVVAIAAHVARVGSAAPKKQPEMAAFTNATMLQTNLASEEVLELFSADVMSVIDKLELPSQRLNALLFLAPSAARTSKNFLGQTQV
jgi:hypothetical protein